MFKLTLAVLVLAVGIRALVQIRKNPDYSRATIIRSLIGVLLFYIFGAAGMLFVFFVLPPLLLGKVGPELLVGAYVLWMSAGVVGLVWGLKRLDRRSPGESD